MRIRQPSPASRHCTRPLRTGKSWCRPTSPAPTAEPVPNWPPPKPALRRPKRNYGRRWGRPATPSTRKGCRLSPGRSTPDVASTPSGSAPTTRTSPPPTPPSPRWIVSTPGRTPMSRIGNAVAQRQNTLTTLIERQKPEIARALPRHMDPDRLARIATTVMRQTPQLAQCTPESFLGALMTCAQLGLEPGPLGHAYLVPYGREVTFVPGYRGLVELARRSGQVQSVQARIVRDGDEFDYEFGLEPKLRHRPTADVDKPVTHAYAVLRLKDGGVDFDVMTRAEIDAIRKRSRAATNGPWVTDYAEMAKKTVLRRLLKTAPMSIEYHQAVANDEQVRTSVAADAIDLTIPGTVEGELVDDWPPAAQPGDADPAGDPPLDPAEA